jgi:hypothetical protein
MKEDPPDFTNLAGLSELRPLKVSPGSLSFAGRL